MKTLKQYLIERLIIKKSNYKYFPETKEELYEIIKQCIEQEGPEVDLNDIDVSNITDVSKLFSNSKNFNGDISTWDVSNVTDMSYMFYGCKKFNQDISSWDVSKVTDMECMFAECKSFNQDISSWDVSKVKDSIGIFYKCPIEKKYEPHLK